MNRSLYPKNWDQIAFAIKREANWTCQKCGKQCLEAYQEIEEWKRDRRQRAIYTLTVHHIDHIRSNCDRQNLVALCSVCHLRQRSQDRKYGTRTGQLSLI